MDLDELKYQLKNKLSTDHAGRSDEDIASLLNKKTGSIVGKLKKNLWMEILFGLLVVIVFLYIGIWSKYNYLRIYFSVFGILSAVFVGLLIYLLHRTTLLSNTTLPVKGNLQTIVNIIEEFMKRYFQFTMVLIPVCVIFSFILAYNDPQLIPDVDRLARSYYSHVWKMIFFGIVYMALLTVVIYYFTKWYLRKLYGKYISQLKECIEDLKEE